MRGAASVVAVAAAFALASAAAAVTVPPGGESAVRIWPIRYVAHDGLARRAYVVLPRWYGPRDHPPLPLVISPHGRGVPAIDNVRMWGDLPAIGRFAVVNPEGQGRRLTLYSWGDPGEISDLARMPQILRRTLPWLRIAQHRIYAMGGSMGGQETLLLLARYPHLLAGAAAFDAPTDLALRFRLFPDLKHGIGLQRLLTTEVGGPPSIDPQAYAVRSPLDYARELAYAGVPLQIWWSTRDRIVVDQARQSGLLYRRIKAINPYAPVRQFVGTWKHTAEMRPWARLPQALRLLGVYARPPGRSLGSWPSAQSAASPARGSASTLSKTK